ncbi:MAG: hypothetical protein WCB68_16160 [Pyrinomonadaceae bacterium]
MLCANFTWTARFTNEAREFLFKANCTGWQSRNKINERAREPRSSCATRAPRHMA